jgi:hypothetical protein
MNKIEPITTQFKTFKLRELLNELEQESPDITKRIFNFIYEDTDPYFLPQDIRGLYLNGRLYSLNLFYYGVGDEYPIKNVDKDEIENSQKVFPESFINNSIEKQMRLDFNLIWSVYQDDIEDIENFLVTI